MLLDTHFHLDFIQDLAAQREFVAELERHNAAVVAQTVLPSDYRKGDISRWSSVGYHPWFIEDGAIADELNIFAGALGSTHLVGEIGLDFSRRGLARAPEDLQIKVFRSIVRCCAERSKNQSLVLSIHAVRSAATVLDILEQDGETDSGSSLIPVFHWFSDGGRELNRLLKNGYLVSINQQMLATRRGRAYAQQIPASQMLLETDLPEQAPLKLTPASAGQYAQKHAEVLQKTLDQLCQLRNEDISSQLLENQQKIYELPAQNWEHS